MPLEGDGPVVVVNDVLVRARCCTRGVRPRLAAVVCAVVAAVGVSSCSSSSPVKQTASRVASSSAASSSLPTDATSTTAAPTTPLTGVAARCGPPERRDAALRVLKGPGTARLPAAVLGSGPTTAVFLHQTDGNGLCGWWPYAAWLTSHYKIRAVLLDLCNYNTKAVCPEQTFADDQRAQVAVGMRFAHGLGASRVVLVGASMGGALALASAQETGAAAVVDLSGPPGWGNAEASEAAPKLDIPLLVAASPTDGDVDYPALQKAFLLDTKQPKRFVSPVGGAHGWDLVENSSGTGWSPLASQVARWITGDYSAR